MSITENRRNETLAWHNNCSFNALSHYLIQNLGRIGADNEIAAVYQPLLDEFKRYYELDYITEPFQAQHLIALFDKYPNPLDREMIFSPVLRSYLGILLKDNQEIKNSLRFQFEEGSRQFLRSNNISDVDITYRNFIIPVKHFLEGLSADELEQFWNSTGYDAYVDYVSTLTNDLEITATELGLLANNLRIPTQICNDDGSRYKLTGDNTLELLGNFAVQNVGSHWIYEDTPENTVAHNRCYPSPQAQGDTFLERYYNSTVSERCEFAGALHGEDLSENLIHQIIQNEMMEQFLPSDENMVRIQNLKDLLNQQLLQQRRELAIAAARMQALAAGETFDEALFLSDNRDLGLTTPGEINAISNADMQSLASGSSDTFYTASSELEVSSFPALGTEDNEDIVPKPGEQALGGEQRLDQLDPQSDRQAGSHDDDLTDVQTDTHTDEIAEDMESESDTEDVESRSRIGQERPRQQTTFNATMSSLEDKSLKKEPSTMFQQFRQRAEQNLPRITSLEVKAGPDYEYSDDDFDKLFKRIEGIFEAHARTQTDQSTKDWKIQRVEEKENEDAKQSAIFQVLNASGNPMFIARRGADGKALVVAATSLNPTDEELRSMSLTVQEAAAISGDKRIYVMGVNDTELAMKMFTIAQEYGLDARMDGETFKLVKNDPPTGGAQLTAWNQYMTEHLNREKAQAQVEEPAEERTQRHHP